MKVGFCARPPRVLQPKTDVHSRHWCMAQTDIYEQAAPGTWNGTGCSSSILADTGSGEVWAVTDMTRANGIKTKHRRGDADSFKWLMRFVVLKLELFFLPREMFAKHLRQIAREIS